MTRRLYRRQRVGLLGALLLLVGCAGSPAAASEPAPQPVPTLGPTQQPPPDSGPAGTATATPDPCTGWSCPLRGVVYVDAVDPDHALAGTPVDLSHLSYCSPTRGQHETTTGPEGGFAFEVYLHDTDTFLIYVERDGYQPVRRSIGGFDCLYCACPPVEIVLQPLGSPTAPPKGRNAPA